MKHTRAASSFHLFLLLLSASFLCTAQQKTSVKLPLSFDLKHHVSGYRALGSKLYLMGSRVDTFSVATSGWGATDSSQYSYQFFSGDTLVSSIINSFLDPGNGWTNQIQSFYQYDGELRDTTITVQTWSNIDTSDNWVNAAKTSLIYDADKLATIIQYQWDSIAFVYGSKTIYQYDTAQNLVRQVLLSYNSTTMQFDSTQRFDYTYDSINRKTTEIDYIYAGSWLPSLKYLLNYNSENLLTASIAQIYTTKFVNNYKDSLDYDANNNRIALSRYTWDNPKKAFDIYTIRITSEYDSNNQLTKEITYYGSGTDWIPLSQALYTYDSQGNNTYTLIQTYDGSTSTYINLEQDIFHYSPFIIIGITAVNDPVYRVLLFPNPTSQQLSAVINLKRSSDLRVQVINTRGSVISDHSFSFSPGENTFSADLSNLPKGEYFLKVINTTLNEQSVNKFMKQ